MNIEKSIESLACLLSNGVRYLRIRSDYIITTPLASCDIESATFALYEESILIKGLHTRLLEMTSNKFNFDDFPQINRSFPDNSSQSVEELVNGMDDYLEFADHLLDAPTVRILIKLQKSINSNWGFDAKQDCFEHEYLLGVKRAKGNYYFGSKGYDKLRIPSNILNDYDEETVKRLWLQRDELDAVESFLNSYKHLCDVFDFDGLTVASRFAWDESRHHLIGLRELKKLGIDEEDLPYNVVGTAVRMALPGLLSQAQTHMFGEAGIISDIKKTSQGNSEISEVFKWIFSDENLHLREGMKMLDERGFNNQNTRDEITSMCKNRLLEIGIFDEDYISNLNVNSLKEILGE